MSKIKYLGMFPSPDTWWPEQVPAGGPLPFMEGSRSFPNLELPLCFLFKTELLISERRVSSDS